jgi:hypothetical protein
MAHRLAAPAGIFAILLTAGSASCFSAESQSASALLDSIGMNTHLGAPETVPKGNGYANTETMIRELDYIHVRHLRDSLHIGPNLPKLDALHRSAGGKFDLVYDYYGKDGGSGTLAAALANVQDHPELIEAFEGPNEPDWFGIHYNRTKGARAVIAAQRELYAAVKNNPKLSAIPVYCPALSYPARGGMADGLGNLAPVCDASASHDYVENITLGTFLPYEYLARWTQFPLAFAPGLPRVITEGGWGTNPPDVQGVDEATQAKYLLIYLLDAFSQGIQRSYVYQLSDDQPDPSYRNVEFHYGVFRSDGTPKPAAVMLSNLHGILGEGASPPGSLDWSLEGLPSATSHQLLLRRGDGTYVLALWNEARLWDRHSHRSIPQQSIDATLTFQAPIGKVEILDPLNNAALARPCRGRPAG